MITFEKFCFSCQRLEKYVIFDLIPLFNNWFIRQRAFIEI